MKDFKAPDLKAPRFRKTVCDILKKDFYNDFRKTYPEYNHLKDGEIKVIISLINGKIWETVLAERDGVELPNGLGYIFLGTCPKKKGDNTNYALSAELKVKIQHRNWESDQYTAKIFYTNFENKYRFKNHDQWGFVGVRQFKRMVPVIYPANWQRYIKVEPMLQISTLYRKQSYKQKRAEETKEKLKLYDEFSLN